MRDFNSAEFKAESSRKAIHVLIALVPFLAAINRSNTALLLMAGILIYVWAEGLRFLGFSPPLISSLTTLVLREREKNRFVLAPVTLGLGALLSLLLFPPQIAKAAIFALAFGDSAACLIGKFLGRLRPSFMAGKSIEGSLTCLLVSALAVFCVFREWKIALTVGAVSMIIDTLSFKDFDNLLLPLAAGLSAMVFI
jgi:dolichol kinase